MTAVAKTPANWLSKLPNPFGLRVPPTWWLQELAAYDSELVVFPSQQSFHYRLCRRACRTQGIISALIPGSDSAICVNEKIIPVTSIGGDAAFGSWIIQWLSDRDVWKHGGAEAANRLLDEQEATDKAADKRWRDGENTARARSSYRTYTRRAGLSVSLNDVHRGKRSRRATTTPLHARPGSAPVPPTAATPPPMGWGESASGLVTPPTP